MTSSHPVVAAFDLDGTITEGGSVFDWMRFTTSSFKVYSRAATLLVPLINGAIRASTYADNAKERLFVKVLGGLPFEEVRQRSKSFALEHLEHDGRDYVITRLRWHLEQGHDVVLVSASPQLYLDYFVEALGAHAGLGTRLAVSTSGTMTGKYDGKNCRGTEKMRRLTEWIESRNYPAAPRIYAYGNSRGDRRLLGMASDPYDVGKLGKYGALRAFPQLAKNWSESVKTA
jgi:HAD superfamily hydrolase (TIGR01490 family)